ncbi:YiaA/YiaB family inner membrane protein [Hyalangium rubrum]|uniref:YiaA/YiaB family inner membrane protein n=1 Tax=Hyalangium rubrum TaxID=3103134 RepID=A0ABU5H5S1_9BACT|nr:YiaA/YiaB family inner membrane protein [Hyalangium sp. s54d21]MDY7228831.1 YiaA/YiaB family inner membrane protein [Hyalangium sp. s54d21]
MSMSRTSPTAAVQPVHSHAWVIQTWLSFVLALGVTAMGVYHLPVDGWMKAFLGMGMLFTVGSTFSLAKTLRDVHEQQRITARIDEARMTKLLAEVDPLSPKL